MPGAFLADDLGTFFNPDEFGDVLTVTAGPLAGSTFNGLLNLPFADPLGVAGSSPSFQTKSSYALAAGTVGTIACKRYRLQAAEPDGTGVTTWPLTEL